MSISVTGGVSSGGAAHSMSAGDSFVHDQGVDSGELMKRKRGRPRKNARGRPPGSRSKPKIPLSPSGGSGFTPHIISVTAGEVISETGGVISNRDSYNGGGLQTSTQSHSSGSAAHRMSAGEGSAGGSFGHDQGVDSGDPVKRKRGRPRKYKPVSDASPRYVSTGEGSAGGSFVHDQGVISGEPVKRKSGRPRKYKPVSDAYASPRCVSTGEDPAGVSFFHDQGVISGEPVKRKSGRPRKCNPGTSGEPMKVKRKKGKPRKYSAGKVPLEFLKPKRAAKRSGILSGASNEDRENAHDRAKKLQSGLEPGIPSFVKPVLQSHVTGEFFLDLPVEFCKKYLPKHDETITLVNRVGEVFLTRYLALKTGLSAGWRAFAIEHDIADGDILVFQMIKPTRFNVYIIRVNLILKKNE